MKALIIFLGILLGSSVAMADGADCTIGNSGGSGAVNTEAAKASSCFTGKTPSLRQFSPASVRTFAASLAQGDRQETPIPGKSIKSIR